MTRVVLDANILLSAYATRGAPHRILRAWPEHFDLCLSSYIVSEVERVLTEPYFARRVTAAARQSYLSELGFAELVELTVPVSGVATQAKDDPILATALNSNADYLVTGDKALLALGAFEGTRIVSAAEFVAILDAS